MYRWQGRGKSDSCILSMGIHNVSVATEENLAISNKLHMHLCFDSAIPLLGTYPKDTLVKIGKDIYMSFLLQLHL